MKKLVFVMFVCIFSVSCHSQTVKMDAQGNYYIPKKKDSSIGKFFNDEKGAVLPVYANSKGRLYVIKRSVDTGKEYRRYLKQ